MEYFESVSLSVALPALAAFLLVFLVLNSLIQKQRIFRFARNYDGYRFYPIIGNGLHIIGKNTFHVTQKAIHKFGLPCNMWLGHNYNYITADATEVKAVLNHPNTFDKLEIYESLEFVFGDTLLMAPVDTWKRHRKYFAKSFGQPMLNCFVHIFYKKSLSLLQVLKEAQKRDPFEIFGRYTLDSFCESTIGIDYDLQVNPKVKLVEYVAELQVIYGNRLLNHFYYPFCLWILSNEGRRALYLSNQAKKFVYDAINERRKTIADNSVAYDSIGPLPLLDSMLQSAGETFSDDQIFREMFLFTNAATDTTSYTLAYFFTMLGMHPHIQEKVYKEIMEVVGCDRPIYSADLPHMKYTERVIFETMRILPAIPFMGRTATADTDIGTKVFPKGTNIVISLFDLHRNEKYWPEPLKFDPDRFLPEETAKREPYAFVPFSGGPRNCIGKTYSIMLMKTCAANVVRNYEMSSPYRSVTELKLTSCVTMKTVHPLECTFTPRMHECK